MKKKFKFIDLFSGIGGFHQAMKVLGGECVFSSEIDPFAIQTYEENYKINPKNDITKVEASDIPVHDVLCAGFPCQAFSKAGSQLGFEDKIKGTLFFDIVRILKTHKTPYIILENVRNLVSHDKGRTWEIIKESLIQLGYVITENPIIISPHHIGIPQHRERVLILGVHKSVGIKQLNINFQKINKNDINIFDSNILERSNKLEEYFISEHEELVLNCWNEFIKGISFIPVKNPKSNNYIKKEFDGTIGFPIWVNEFNNYEVNMNDIPKWKKEIILKNRSLYVNNKEFIDKWLSKWNYLKNF
ncbi:DNA cytosine methyltransferase [Mycoplasmopsis canis]|nr:DNA (cytosine-5-)-methyltransferase [Mycoplasmopsis canis]